VPSHIGGEGAAPSAILHRARHHCERLSLSELPTVSDWPQIGEDGAGNAGFWVVGGVIRQAERAE
jgi:hypothetical protein